MGSSDYLGSHVGSVALFDAHSKSVRRTNCRMTRRVETTIANEKGNRQKCDRVSSYSLLRLLCGAHRSRDVASSGARLRSWIPSVTIFVAGAMAACAVYDASLVGNEAAGGGSTTSSTVDSGSAGGGGPSGGGAAGEHDA